MPRLLRRSLIVHTFVFSLYLFSFVFKYSCCSASNCIRKKKKGKIDEKQREISMLIGKREREKENGLTADTRFWYDLNGVNVRFSKQSVNIKLKMYEVIDDVE